MTLKLKLLLRVVQRRVKNGEKPEEILKDYPKLWKCQEMCSREIPKI